MNHQNAGTEGITLIVGGTVLTCLLITLTTGSILHWLPAAAGIYVGLRAASVMNK